MRYVPNSVRRDFALIFDNVLQLAERVIPQDIVRKRGKEKTEKTPVDLFDRVCASWKIKRHIDGQQENAPPDLFQIENQHAPPGEAVQNTVDDESPAHDTVEHQSE